ncbi:hypothetical protein [Exiguobacterium sp. S22-S28]|uniref:hypothetical protein n=1 Tax=Exiguobacterium sp. S22-S28 TaxID=3342768 RepID=UPI00372D2BA2
MPRPARRPEEQEFRYLMLEVGLTRKQLAVHYRVSNTTIDKWVHFFEINCYGRWKLRPPDEELEILYDRFHDEPDNRDRMKRKRQLAAERGVSEHTVTDWFKRVEEARWKKQLSHT